MKVIQGDITQVQADIIVSAANGIGYMGGWTGRYYRLKGVAESIHFVSKGIVEKEAKIACKKKKWLPRILCGYKAGEVYVTGAGNLSAKWIIHAVTMPYPGMKTNIVTVKDLLPVILRESKRLGATSIALPLLGTGTGGLAKENVLAIYEKDLSEDHGLEVIVVSK
ncbi:macro domain-containing protein [Brevibacillus sp. AG]|uniref:macro domain-containing protein n=1 Tax=Brevibacillus sp. AG TaxID=3020891 RepID=UPI00232EA4DE|nr:macro domain-containing protein [Brevibacillus sp. AG]MDC0764277.1 macro domain-containing protein [Brevibacillus sp. AG]